MISDFLKNNLPSYETVLPISKKKLRFRPMTVKEEKLLLVAQQSMSVPHIAQSMIQILKNCYEDLKNPEELAIADAEKAFLMLRCKSIGEEASFIIKCPFTNEAINTNINLENFTFDGIRDEIGKIKLTDNMMIVLREPTLEYFLSYDESSGDDLRNLFKNSFVELQTESNTYTKNEVSEADLNDFYDYLTTKQLKLISEYMNNIPRFKKKIKYTTKDGINREFLILGIDSFFGYASVT
jgi:hypothetical protein